MGLILSNEELEYCKNKIVNFIKSETKQANASYGIVAISGGIDSTLTLFLAKEALKDRLIALIMPERGVTREEDIEDAKRIAESLGVKHYTIEINNIIKSFVKTFPKIKSENELIAFGNLKARIRMCLNYLMANLTNGIVIGTGNKTELLLGYFCYDERTRVLTPEGLKTYKELKPGDKVFSINLKTGEVEEALVKNVYVFNYEGYMIKIDDGNVDLLVTPNHRMLVKDKNDTLTFVVAEEFLNNEQYIPLPKPWCGLRDSEYIFVTNVNENVLKKIPTKFLFYMIGLYLGKDVYFKEKSKKNGSINLPLPDKNEAKEKLLEILRKFDIKHEIHKDFVRINSKALYEIFSQCGEVSEKKRIPRWVLKYPADKLIWLYKGLIESNNHDNKNLRIRSLQLALDVVELCSKLGSIVKVVRSSSGFYSLTILNKLKVIKINPKNVSKVYYKGIVWCPDVPPYHNLLVERNGKFVFCGNTKYGDGGVDILPIGDLYKTQVKQLAKYVGIPDKIINKTPSSGLWKGQTDEDELGASYEVIDNILYKLYDEGKSVELVAKELGVSVETILRFKKMVERNYHKRQGPKILKLF